MTAKGLAVARRVLATNAGSIALVVGARDPGLSDDAYDAIAKLCQEHGVPHVDRAQAPRTETPWAIAVSWRWLLHTDHMRVVVLHDSLLPRLRGFNPLVTALINGDAEIGVTALLASHDMDRGDILAQDAIQVTYPITISEAIDCLLPVYESLAARVVDQIAAGVALRATAQDEAAATYSLWRDEDDYLIDWTGDAADVRRFIDAVGVPYRGAATWLNGIQVRVLAAQELPDVRIENRTPGKVLQLREGAPVVVCGRGLLLVTSIVDDAGQRSQLPLTRLRARFRNVPSATN